MTMKARVTFDVELPERFTVDTPHEEIREFLGRMYSDIKTIRDFEIIQKLPRCPVSAALIQDLEARLVVYPPDPTDPDDDIDPDGKQYEWFSQCMEALGAGHDYQTLVRVILALYHEDPNCANTDEITFLETMLRDWEGGEEDENDMSGYGRNQWFECMQRLCGNSHCHRAHITFVVSLIRSANRPYQLDEPAAEPEDDPFDHLEIMQKEVHHWMDKHDRLLERAEMADDFIKKLRKDEDDRTMIQYYKFEKPISLRDIVCTFEQDLNDNQEQLPNGWSVCTDAQKCRHFTNHWSYSMCEKLDLDGCCDLPNDLRHYLNFLFRESDAIYSSAVFTFELNIPVGGRFADGIEILFNGATEDCVPKGCFRMIEKYLTHTIDHIKHEPLEKVLSEIHELQTELGLTDYAFRDSSDED